MSDRIITQGTMGDGTPAGYTLVPISQRRPLLIEWGGTMKFEDSDGTKIVVSLTGPHRHTTADLAAQIEAFITGLIDGDT